MISYISESFPQFLASLGNRAQNLRLHQNLTQKDLATRSGVGVATIYRFEKNGQISLENALRIAMALGVDSAFKTLFETPKHATLDEILARSALPKRKRAQKKRAEKK